AAEHIMGPKRRLPRMKRVRQELKLRLEMRFGVVGNGHRARQPWQCKEYPPYSKCGSSRLVTACKFRIHGTSGSTPHRFRRLYRGTLVIFCIEIGQTKVTRRRSRWKAGERRNRSIAAAKK